jgi:hypothetical protein
MRGVLAMEHRWGHRVSCGIDVKLFADPASVAWGRIRDLSISGGYIETALPLRPLSTLRLVRVPSGRPTCEPKTIRAIVVRRDSNGVGVEWLDGEMDAVEALLQEARAAQPPVPSPVAATWLAR